MKFLAGGQARVLLGMVFGKGSAMNGSAKISSSVGRFEGSRTSILLMRLRAFSEMVTCSGNV